MPSASVMIVPVSTIFPSPSTTHSSLLRSPTSIPTTKLCTLLDSDIAGTSFFCSTLYVTARCTGLLIPSPIPVCAAPTLQARTRTVPASPSTSTIAPSGISFVAPLTPTTQGTPYSREAIVG